MPEETRPYFDAMQDFDWAMGERRFPQALVALKAGLRHSPRALLSMKQEWGSIPRVPFIGTKAGALAALMNDAETFDLMEQVAELVGTNSQAEVTRFRNDALAVTKVRRLLQSTPEIPLDDLKQEFDPETKSRLARLIAWMEKNSELSVEKSGRNSIIKAGAAPRQGSIVAPTFRERQPVASPRVLPLPRLARERGRPKSASEPARIVLDEAKVTGLPPAQRLPGVMQTHPLKDGFWLIGHPRTLPSGAGETKVVVKSATGETLTNLVLPHRVVRAFSSFHREHIVILDSTLTVVVFDLMGGRVLEFALRNNAEVRSVLDTLDDSTKATAVLRAVDVCPLSGDIAFSIIDSVWRFTASGDLITALQIRAVDPSAGIEALAPQAGSEMSIVERGQIGWDRDWVYFLRFAEQNGALFLGTYAGNLLRLSRHGEVEAHWDVFSSPNDVLEQEDKVIVAAERGTWFLTQKGVVEHHACNGGVFFSETQLVSGAHLFNPSTLKNVKYVTPADVRGVYRVNGKLRIEMKTSYCDVDFP